MGRLDGKVAIVTGGASGIGAATARRFVAEGARVVIADVNDEAGEGVARALGAAAAHRHTDVSSLADLEAAVAFAGVAAVVMRGAMAMRKTPDTSFAHVPRYRRGLAASRRTAAAR